MEKNENSPELSIEEAFDRIERTVKKLEDADVSLEESFELYKNGMDLLKECTAKIDEVEKKVMEISASGEINEFE